MPGSCFVRDCGDPTCQVCTTAARGFPQPLTWLEAERKRRVALLAATTPGEQAKAAQLYLEEAVHDPFVGTKPGRWGATETADAA